MHLNIKVKIVLRIFMLLIGVIATISTVFCKQTYNQISNLLRNQARNSTEASVTAVDIEQFEQLTKALQVESMDFDQSAPFTSESYYSGSFEKYYCSAFVPILNTGNQVVQSIEYDYKESELSSQLKRINESFVRHAIKLMVIANIINGLLLKRMIV